MAVFARRTGGTWFLALLNGPTTRSVSVPLSFLGEGEYWVTEVRDGNPDGTEVRVSERAMGRGETLRWICPPEAVI